MSDFSTVKHRARKIASEATSAQIQELAKLVAKLADGCEDVEKLAKDAADDARRAKHR